MVENPFVQYLRYEAVEIHMHGRVLPDFSI